jgi:hypothetical protein
VLSLRMVAAIEIVKQSQLIRPPVQLIWSSEFLNDNSRDHSLMPSPMVAPKTNARADIKRFLLRLFCSLLEGYAVDSPEYTNHASLIYKVGESLNRSQLDWSRGVDWLDVAKISHVLALTCRGGLDDKALELTMEDIKNKELLGNVILYVHFIVSFLFL